MAIDGLIISNLIGIEIQAQDDRRISLQASIDDPELESPATSLPCNEVESAPSFMLTQEHYDKDLQWNTNSGLGDDLDFEAEDDERDGGGTSWGGPKLLTYTRHQGQP